MRTAIDAPYLEQTFKGFQTVFEEAFADATSYRDTIAMVVNSQTREENYAWLGQFPALREWIGDRIVRQFSAHGFTITNRKFETTVEVKREDIEDDRLGVYRPMFAELGRVAKVHPDMLIFATLAAGFTGAGFDGAAFFSNRHPLDGIPLSPAEPALAPALTWSNIQTSSTLAEDDGDGPAWYLLDLSRAIKPIIWQGRSGYELQSVTDPKTYNVFMTDLFLYGVRARVNCGYGLPQLAYASRYQLTEFSFSDARAAMMNYVGDAGQLLGIMPTHLIVPPALERKARELIYGSTVTGGVSNIWKDAVQLIVSPWLR